MSRERAARDPYWATSLSRMRPNAAAATRGLYRLIQRSPALSPYLWIGRGWSPEGPTTEHGSGYALDVIVSRDVGIRPTAAEKAAGEQLATWLIANHKRLGIRWIIFTASGRNEMMIWNPARGGWRSKGNQGSVSANHIDHIHIYFSAATQWPAALDSAVVGGTPDTRTPIERLIDTMDEKKLRQIIRTEAQAAVNAALWEKVIPDSTKTAVPQVLRSSWRNVMINLVQRLERIEKAAK